MSLEIKSTNLILLRDLLEGKYDDILNSGTRNIIITNDSDKFLLKPNESLNDNNGFTSQSKIHKDKRMKKRKRNSNFYLDKNDVVNRTWLKEKKILSEKKKKELKMKRKEEQLQLLEETKQKEERESQSREAYDKWLKDTRNFHKSSNCNKIQDKSSKDKRKSDAALEAFSSWITKKEKEKQKPIKSQDIVDGAKERVNIPESSTTGHTITKVSQPRKSRSSTSGGTESKTAQSKPQVTELGEDMNLIISNLRKEKNKEKERSKLRVDSGIFYKRESQNKAVIKSSGEAFQWQLVTNDGGEGPVDLVPSCRRSDSRSRHVDWISHEHENPFIDRSSITIAVH